MSEEPETTMTLAERNPWIDPFEHDFPRGGPRNMFLAWGPGWLCPFPAYAVPGDPPSIVHCVAGDSAHNWTMPANAWKPFDDPPAAWQCRPDRWAALDCPERNGSSAWANVRRDEMASAR